MGPITGVRRGPVSCLCPGCGNFLRRPQTGRLRCGGCGLVFDLYVLKPAVRPATPEPLSGAAPEAATEDKPACVVHPQNASVVACSRCGDYICEVCRIRMEGGELCPKCFEHRVDHAELRSLQRKFRLAQYSVVVGIVSNIGALLMPYIAVFGGMVAVALGIRALIQIRKKPGLSGKKSAVTGIILGVTSILLSIAWLVIMIMGLSGAFR